MRKLTPQVGEVHGGRTIIQVLANSPDIHQRVLTECKCGRIHNVPYTALRYGKRDGCLKCAQRHEIKEFTHLIGKRFYERTVVEVTRNATDNIVIVAACDEGHKVTMQPAMIKHRGPCGECARAAELAHVSAARLERRASVMAMKAQGMSQIEIADALGYTPSMITLIVQGKR